MVEEASPESSDSDPDEQPAAKVAARLAANGLEIHGVLYATPRDLTDSVIDARSQRSGKAAAKEIKSVAEMISVPTLTASNWRDWQEAVKRVMSFTGTSAALLPKDALEETPTLGFWRGWWLDILRKSDTKTPFRSGIDAREMLITITANNTSREAGALFAAVRDFWSWQPGRTSLTTYLNEHEKRLNRLGLYADIDGAMAHVRAIFIDRVSAIAPELGMKIRHLLYSAALAEAKAWAESTITRDQATKPISCNFYKKKGHKERDCRAKKATQSTSSASSVKPQTKPRKAAVNMVVGSSDGGYLLDTGADSHVSGNIDDLSCYVPEPTTVTIAGGDQVTSPGHGRLVMPSLDRGSEHLPGAILLPGQKNRLLSLKQLEKAGYALQWASHGPISIIRPDKSTCATLYRVDGRLVWKPRQERVMSASSRTMSAPSRD